MWRQLGKPMLVPTGGATLEDVDRAVETILPLNPQLCLLQCTAAYPADVSELNLGVITTLRERYPELVIGLSDHQDGIAMALVAYMLGARVIEKHFTLSHTWKGTDHAFSLMPEGMRKLVRDLRRDAEPRSATASSAATRARSGRSRRWARSSSPRATCRGACARRRRRRDQVAGRRRPARRTSTTPCSAAAWLGPLAADQGLTLLDLESSLPRRRSPPRRRDPARDPLFDLSGRMGVVTGGLGQLGAEYARALAERGMRVAILDVAAEPKPGAADLTPRPRRRVDSRLRGRRHRPRRRRARDG